MAVVAADFVDMHHVGMIQAGDSLGLVHETQAMLGVGVGPGEDHLDGHDAVQGYLPGLVDDAHAAAAQSRRGSRIRDMRGNVKSVRSGRRGQT